MNLRIAKRLLDYRRANNFSQEELAARIGVSRQAVSKWERVEASPDTDNLIALAELYNVTIDELIHGTADPVPISGSVNSSEAEDDGSYEAAETPAPTDCRHNKQHAQGWFAAILPTLTLIAYLLIAFTVKGGWIVGVLVFFLNPIIMSFITAVRKRKPSKFSYPSLVALLYFAAGLIFHRWHPEWIIFLTIPIYYTICTAIENRRKHRR